MFSEIYSGGLHYIRIDIHTGLSAYNMCAGFVLLVCNACQDRFCCLYFCLKRSWCLSGRQLEAVVAEV